MYPQIQTHGMPGMVTPQAKLIEVANNAGNPFLKSMQGTSRIIYDSLPLDGRTSYDFFEGANARQFPFTNVNNSGGKLGVAEGMVIQFVSLLFFTVVDSNVTNVQTLADIPNFQLGEMSFLTGEQQVLKRIKMSEFSDQNNKDARIDKYNKYRFETYLTIQSLLEFIASVRPAFPVTEANSYVQLILEGTGSLYSAKGPQ